MMKNPPTVFRYVSTPALYSKFFTKWCTCASNYIHHTLNVKLITARGPQLAYTSHKGSQAGVRKSALTVDAAHINSYVKLLLS